MSLNNSPPQSHFFSFPLSLWKQKKNKPQRKRALYTSRNAITEPLFFLPLFVQTSRSPAGRRAVDRAGPNGRRPARGAVPLAVRAPSRLLRPQQSPHHRLRRLHRQVSATRSDGNCAQCACEIITGRVVLILYGGRGDAEGFLDGLLELCCVIMVYRNVQSYFVQWNFL